jgi:putative membrane protein
MMGFGGFGIFFAFFFVIVIVGAIALVALLFPRINAPQTASPASHIVTPDNDALEILKQRYARGELTRAEYEEMKQDILSN